MTTIAARAGVMACDSAYSAAGSIVCLQTKILRTKHNLLIGGAGDCSDRDLNVVLNEVRRSSDFPSLKDLNSFTHDKSDLCLLIYFPNREIWQLEKGTDSPMELFQIKEAYAAIGSGALGAITAMDLDCSAIRAVEIAARRDNASRLPVHYEYLTPPPRKKKTKRSRK